MFALGQLSQIKDNVISFQILLYSKIKNIMCVKPIHRIPEKHQYRLIFDNNHQQTNLTIMDNNRKIYNSCLPSNIYITSQNTATSTIIYMSQFVYNQSICEEFPYKFINSIFYALSMYNKIPYHMTMYFGG